MERITHKNQMESTRLPLLNSLLPILRDIVFDLFLLHERGQNRLVDRIIWKLQHQNKTPRSLRVITYRQQSIR